MVVFAMGIGTNVNAANLQDIATSAHNVHQLSAKTPPGSLTGDIANAMCSSMSVSLEGWEGWVGEGCVGDDGGEGEVT